MFKVKFKKEKNMEKDLVIIGAGPGGYTGAIEASKLGRKVTLVEKENLGGTCLNFGCMPTKSLLHVAHQIKAINELKKNNIAMFGDVAINYENIINISREHVKKLEEGVNFLMKKYNIEIIKGTASFLSDKKITVSSLELDALEEITANDFIIATGSLPKNLPNIPVNGINVHNSRTFLLNKKFPKNILIIGSGAIGLEFASFLNAIGAQVTIVEYMDRIMPQADSTISNTLKRVLEEKGIKIYTSSQIINFSSDNKILAEIKNKKEEVITFEGDSCLIAIGVIPNIDNLNLKNTTIKTNEKNFIEVNEKMETTAPHHFAIGDVIGMPTLAHVATCEARILVNHICNIESRLSKKNIPLCSYTIPQVASVGITEDEAKQKNISYKSVRMPFLANGKALVSEGSQGLIKLIFSPESKKILGCHILQENATELLPEIVLAMNNELTVNDIKESIHAHPTLAEIISDVCALAN